jgi:hypothetical protein
MSQKIHYKGIGMIDVIWRSLSVTGQGISLFSRDNVSDQSKQQEKVAEQRHDGPNEQEFIDLARRIAFRARKRRIRSGRII